MAVILGVFNGVGASAASLDDAARVRAAAMAGGCDFGKGDGEAPAAALQILGGGDPSLRIVAALTGAMGSDDLGALCVAIVREANGGFAKVASLPPDADIEPPADVDPTSTRSVSIDRLAFPFAPNETAIAVRASGRFESTSTGATWTTLYLFRRRGARLTPIFDAEVENSDVDKTEENGAFHGKAFVIRFGSRMTKGAYDLIMAPKTGHGRATRYVWTGDRYAPAP